MARPKIRKCDDPKQHWICEELTCRRKHLDPSPPAACVGCGGVMFENLFDMLMESGAQTGHTS